MSLIENQKRLAQEESKQETGQYEMRPRRINDYNPYWKAGWKIPEEAKEIFDRPEYHDLWAIVDTGTDSPVISGTYERILAIYQNYLLTGELSFDIPRSIENDDHQVQHSSETDPQQVGEQQEHRRSTHPTKHPHQHHNGHPKKTDRYQRRHRRS